MHLLEEYGADAVRYWAASGRPGTDTAFDPQADEGRPAAGGQAVERLEVRARRAAAGRASALTHPLDRAMVARLAAVVDGGDGRLRGVRLRARARAHGGVLLVVLRLLPGARQGPPLRARARRARRPSAWPCACRCRSFSACSRRFCRSSPRRSGRGGRRARCTMRAWPDVRGAARRAGAARRRASRTTALDVCAEVLREVRKAKSEARLPDARAGRAA